MGLRWRMDDFFCIYVGEVESGDVSAPGLFLIVVFECGPFTIDRNG
jgi:hypothetical protein